MKQVQQSRDIILAVINTNGTISKFKKFNELKTQNRIYDMIELGCSLIPIGEHEGCKAYVWEGRTHGVVLQNVTKGRFRQLLSDDID